MKTKRNTPGILDRFIEWLSPAAGMERMRNRAKLDFHRRNYSAADVGRRTEGWRPRPGQGPNAPLRRSLPLMRERSRDLVRNNPWANSIIGEIVANIVHYGIIAKFSTGKKNGVVPPLWQQWAESTQCDAMQRKDLYDIQRLVVRTWVEAGECFIRRVWREDWKPGEIPFALQVLEPEFIDQTKDGSDNTKLGVKFNDAGVPLGYWVYKHHPGEAVANESFFVDASDMIHMFMEDRPGQIRGIPLMTPIMLRMYDLDAFEQAELVKQEIAAMFAGFRKKKDGYIPVPDENGVISSSRGNVSEHIEPGAIEILDPDDDITFANPPQRTGYGEYVKQNVLASAAGVGMAYENASGDYGKVTFLNGRMGQLRFFRRVDQWQYLMVIPQFCDRIAKWFKDGAIIAGQDMSAMTIRWQPPTKQMVDPSREVPAENAAIRMGLKTHFEAIRGQGNDPVPFLLEYKAGIDLLRELGIVLTSDAELVSDAGQKQNQGANLGDDDGSQEEDSSEKEENSEEE